jgi:hypothetical protein
MASEDSVPHSGRLEAVVVVAAVFEAVSDVEVVHSGLTRGRFEIFLSVELDKAVDCGV